MILLSKRNPKKLNWESRSQTPIRHLSFYLLTLCLLKTHWHLSPAHSFRSSSRSVTRNLSWAILNHWSTNFVTAKAKMAKRHQIEERKNNIRLLSQPTCTLHAHSLARNRRDSRKFWSAQNSTKVKSTQSSRPISHTFLPNWSQLNAKISQNKKTSTSRTSMST